MRRVAPPRAAVGQSKGYAARPSGEGRNARGKEADAGVQVDLSLNRGGDVGGRSATSKRRAARGLQKSRIATRERDRRLLDKLSEQRIEMIENILCNKYFGEGGRGFGEGSRQAVVEDVRGPDDDVDDSAGAASSFMSLAENEEMLREQRSRVHRAASASRAPLGGKKLLRLGYPLVFLGGLPKKFNSERWLREFLAAREDACGEQFEGGSVVRADPVVVSPEEYKHTARLCRGQSAPCRGYAIVAIADEAGARRFIERYDKLSATVAGKQCRLTARMAHRSELLRLKRHPTMKGLILAPFEPEEENTGRIDDDVEDEEVAQALSSALDFERLVPGDADDIQNSIRDISSSALKMGKWKKS